MRAGPLALREPCQIPTRPRPSHSSSVVVDRRERGRRLLAAVEAALPKPDIMPALQFVARVRQQPDLDEPVPLVQSDTGRVGQRDNPDRGPKTLAFQPGQQLGVQGVAHTTAVAFMIDIHGGLHCPPIGVARLPRRRVRDPITRWPSTATNHG